MTDLFRPFRPGMRSLRSRPGFAAAVILTLAFSIGGATALYTLLQAIFLNPVAGVELGRHDAMYRTEREPSGEFTGMRNFSYDDYLDLRGRTRNYTDLALFQWSPMNLSTGEQGTRTAGAFISENYFSLLGLEPALGRFFTAEETAVGGPYQVVVLGYELWRSVFGGADDVIGRTVQVNGQPFEVVGVAPREFQGTELMVKLELWVPISSFEDLSPAGLYFRERATAFFRLFGERAPGISMEQGRNEMTQLAEQLAEEYPEVNRDRSIAVQSMAAAAIHHSEQEQYQGYAKVLVALVLTILAVASINVANLLVVRGLDLQRELALRQAIGGSRRALVLRLISEFGFLFAVGGLAALPLAWLVLRLLLRLMPAQLALTDGQVALDGPILLFALGVTLVTVCACSLVPIVRSSKPDLTTPLKSGPAGGSRDGGRPWGRRALVVSQLSLALVALIAAATFIANLDRVKSIPLGFEPDRLGAITTAPGESGYDREQSLEVYRRILDEVRALPGVESAAFSENRLLRGAIFSNKVQPEGAPEPVGFGDRIRHRTNVVTPGFFDTAGIPLSAGRDFGEEDCADCLPVAVVNQTLADTLWPGENPIGKRFILGEGLEDPEAAGALKTVIGVARDMRYRKIKDPPEFFIYVPLTQTFAPAMVLHVRAKTAVEPLFPTLRETIQGVAPGLPLADVDTMHAFVAEAMWLERTGAFLFSLFAALALLLAMIGVYSLMAFTVRRRRHEIGVRFALGAQRGRVFGRILGEAAVMALLATTVGLLLSALLVGPFLESHLYRSEGVPWGAALAQAALLGLAALAGSTAPAARAARLAPSDSLRETA